VKLSLIGVKMLIKFSVENFLSFRKKVEFTTIASIERQHSQRLIKDPKTGLKLVPITAIYGGNASGKSNLFKAIDFAKELITEGTKPEQPIRVNPFRLDSLTVNQPSEFVFEMKTPNNCYKYGFKVDREKVHSEWLKEIKKNSEKTLFERDESKQKKEDRFDISHFKRKMNAEDFRILKFNAIGTRPNMLFLTESVQRNMHIFKEVYDWFNTSLTLIFPESTIQGIEQSLLKMNELHAFCNNMLHKFGTGIDRLSIEDISFESADFPKGVKDRIQAMKQGEVMEIRSNFGERYTASMQEGRIIMHKLVSVHKSLDGKTDIKFELLEESQGTQRLLDLLPAFYGLSTVLENKVFLIDEINRSLHPILTRSLIEYYLASCNEYSSSQLIFTTHDLLLMDQDLMRRDEMWLLEKDEYGSSELFAISDFKGIRYDKNLLKNYLVGRLGGIPQIQIYSIQKGMNKEKENKVKETADGSTN
jgi:uncharacterized protein